MKRVVFFDYKEYDKKWFDKASKEYDIEIKYYKDKLSEDTAVLARGSSAVIAFVNDTIDNSVIDILCKEGIEIIGLRSAGYNNVDLKAAFDRIHVVRVPSYSPNAVAEYTMSLLLTLIRKTHKAYNRTREHNFNINGLSGFNLNGKTIGVIGTGKIGKIFIDICKGFGMNVIAYDLFPDMQADINYVSLEELYKNSDIISLHSPLTKETYHMINEDSLKLMKENVLIINTSRGALIESNSLLDALKEHRIGGAALDVYEEEEEFFFEDFSNEIISDDTLSMLITLPNVLVTSHQAFLTDEALKNIAYTTIENIDDYFNNRVLKNEICYMCPENETCKKDHKKNCF